MDPEMLQQTDDTAQDAARKRRFRFSRRTLDADLRQVDELAERADRLHLESVPGMTLRDETLTTRQPVSSHDEVASAAALEALAALDHRLRTEPSPTAVAHVTPVIGPGQSNVDWPAPQATAPAPAGYAPITTPESSVSNEPTTYPHAQPAHFEPAPQQDAVLIPTTPTAATMAAPAAFEPVAAEPAPRSGMLVDVNRIIRMLEEEAEAARSRIDHELDRARGEADGIIRNANADAEHIREHAQQQARVLLGEVEEIITDAQRTGQQILRKADEDAEAIRRKAGDLVLDAEEEARRIIDTARREGEQILAEQRRMATLRAQEAMREQDRLKEQIQRLEERRRQVLESLEPLIDQLTQMIPSNRNVVDFPAGGAAGLR